jgi:fatty-acyl-CoA synthase
MLDQIGASVLVSHPEYAEKIDRPRRELSQDVELLTLDGLDETPEFGRALSEVCSGVEATEPETAVTEDDMAYINFSSGTTGLPKPLVTRHGQITEMLHIEAGGATEEGRVLNAFGTGFMGWENVTLTNVAVGATTVFHSGEIERVGELVEREALTRVSLITTPWRILLQSGELDAHDVESVESVGVSGEPITPELYRELCETVTENVGTGYGLTETMGSGTSLPARLIDEETIESVGKPGLSCDVRIIEPRSRDPDATVPDGEVGEVLIIGPSVCTEAYDDPEKTEELFHEDGWVFTGDRGYLEDGFLYLQGRADNMIISGGINVYAERVERVLDTHPVVAEVAVVGTPHERWGEAVKAYVVPADPEATADALDEWCRDSDDLADYQRPREYEFVERLPRNNAGKLDRAALRERGRDAHQQGRCDGSGRADRWQCPLEASAENLKHESESDEHPDRKREEEFDHRDVRRRINGIHCSCHLCSRIPR